MLKKDGSHWNKEAQLAFDSLKETIVSLPVLALPDFNKVFVVETIALGLGIEVVLIARTSNRLSKSRTFYSSSIKISI